MSQDERAHLDFCLRLHRVLAPEPDSTTCWSPFSVASALGLVAAGANGPTRDELRAALVGDGAGADLSGLARLLDEGAELTAAADRDDPPKLAVANTLWADASISVRQEFVDELAGRRGGVREAPLRDDPGKARQLINTDVEEITNGLIPELIPAGALRPDTVSALVNALYLKVGWRHPFDRTGTLPRPFHGPTGRIQVPTMRLVERVGYAHADGWQVVSLAAVGGVEAVVLLPDARLADAEPSLTGDRLAGLLDRVQPTRVTLTLPRLRVSTRSDLTRTLGELGVRTVFSNDADLSRISTSPLAVHAVLHEAVLNVDEQGLEGAAATAVLMRLMSVTTTRPVTVQVDRPFQLLVRHAASGAVYFLARITEP